MRVPACERLWCRGLKVFVEVEYIASVYSLRLRRLYFSSKFLLLSVLGDRCWRTHHKKMKPTPLQGDSTQLLLPV